MKKNNIIEISKSIIFTFVFFLTLWISQTIIKSSTLQYIFSFCILLIIILIDVLLKKNSKTNDNSLNFPSLSTNRAFNAVIFIISVVFFTYINNNSKSMLGRSTREIDLSVYIISFFLTVLIYLIRKYFLKYSSQFQILEILLCFCLIILCCFLNFKPYQLHDVYNFEAYWLNVVSLYDGIPFSMSNISFYGHYALLMVPFFKIFGFNLYTVQLIQIIEIFVMFIFLFYVINIISNNKKFQFIAKIFVLYFFLLFARQSIYPQGFPHRLFFVVIIMTLCIKSIFSISQNKMFQYITNIICCLSIIWNFETGIVMTILWSVTQCIVISRGKKFTILILNGCKYIIKSILLTISSWLIVAIINSIIYNGEFISFKEFIYPLGTDFVDGIGSAVDFSIIIWIVILCILILSFIFSLRKILINESDAYYESILVVSISSLMLFPYFYNRAAFFNLIMVCFIQLILLGLLVIVKLKMSQKLSPIIKFICIYFTIFFIYNSLFTYIDTYIDTYMILIKNKSSEEFLQFEKEFIEIIPDNAVFYGYGSSLYKLFVDNTTALPFNSVNFNADGLRKTKEFFDEGQNIIVIIGNDDFVTGMMGYWIGISLEDLEKNYQIQDYTFSYKDGLYHYKILRPNSK